MPINFESHVPSWWLAKPQLKDEVFPTYTEMYVEELKRLNEVPENFPNYNLDLVIGRLSRSIGLPWIYSGKELTYNYLYYLNQLRLSWFQYTMDDGKPISITLVDRQIQTVGEFSKHQINSSYVTEGIQTALLLRNKKALEYYTQIPVTFTGQADQEDLLVEIMMMFHQLIAEGKDSAKEALGAFQKLQEQMDWDTYQRYVAVEGFNQLWVWKIIFEDRKEYAEYISLPVLNIYYQILENNQLGFEDSVRIALEKWKTYYTRVWIDENKEEQDRSLWGQGFLSFPITAACAYAYDRGLRLTSIESSYIPQWLIEGDFGGLSLRFSPENSAD